MARSTFRSLALALSFSLLHCGGTPGVEGSPDDANVKSGQYDGYSVTRPCSGNDDTIGVRGTGKVHFVNEEQRIDFIEKEIKPRLVGTPAVESVGYGQGACGLGITVLTSDWRQVDRIAREIGAVLREHNQSIGATITVGPRDVALGARSLGQQ